METIKRFGAGLGLAAALMIASLLAVAPARAASYIYTFTALDNSLSASGSFFTDINNQVIGFTSTITGFLNENTGPNGIVLNPSFPTQVLSPDGRFIYDNLSFHPLTPYLDSPGILFTTLQNTTGFWNLFFDGNNYQLLKSANGGYPFGTDLPGNLLVSQTPLPAALPLFITGLGALGLLRWRQKRTATT